MCCVLDMEDWKELKTRVSICIIASTMCYRYCFYSLTQCAKCWLSKAPSQDRRPSLLWSSSCMWLQAMWCQDKCSDSFEQCYSYYVVCSAKVGSCLGFLPPALQVVTWLAALSVKVSKLISLCADGIHHMMQNGCNLLVMGSDIFVAGAKQQLIGLTLLKSYSADFNVFFYTSLMLFTMRSDKQDHKFCVFIWL